MAKKKKIRVAFMRVSEEGNSYQIYIGEIDNTLEAYQSYVGGRIEVVGLTDEIDIVLNDEGKFNGSKVNRLWIDTSSEEREVLDALMGNVLACRHDAEGNFTDIKEEDIAVIIQTLIPAFSIEGKYMLMPEGMLPAYNLEGMQDE